MKSSTLKFSCLTLALLVLAGLAFAANTGSVKGKVTDKKTGEALVGVNVQIQGTQQGGATDAEGKYEIINIPPGNYTVVASYVGYNDEKVSNVQVVQDNFAEVDFQLSNTVINLGHEVVVTAQKWQPVQRTSVTDERLITDQDFKRLPVTQLSDLVGMQAGVTTTANTGWVHIRGGRFDDVAYLINGVAAQDMVYGTLWSSPKPTTDALQSVVVITGGFDAEYGNAMSGIIQAVTKEGGEKTSGHLAYTTDDFFPQSTGYNYAYNRLAASLGGPTPMWNRLRYFLSADFFRDADDAGVRYKVNSPRGEYALEGNMTLQMPKEFFLTKQGLKFTLDAYGSNYQWQSWGNAWKYDQAALYANQVRSYKGNFTINHMLSPSTVYEAQVGLLQTSLMRTNRNFDAEAADTTGFWGDLRKLGIWDRYIFRGEDWVFNNPEGLSRQQAIIQLYRSYWLDPNGNKVYAHPGQENWVSSFDGIENPWGVANLFVTQGDAGVWHYRATDQVLGKIDVTHTISKIHEIKAGVDFTQYSLSVYDNSLPWDENPFWDAWNYKPVVADAYLQDQADFEDLVVRAGVRLDYLDSKADVRAFPESLGSRTVIADSFLPVPAKYRLAPRLGISYPITDRIKFRFSYGHFYRNPEFNDLYTYNDRTASEILSRGNIIVGNADMSAEKTIAYEMGFDDQVSDFFEFDMTAFYKDVFDLSGVRLVPALPTPYSEYYNVEYARIQGLEATMSKALNQYWSATVGYTFQIAKGTASTAESQYQRTTPVELDYFLDQDQRHAVHADLAFSFPSDFKVVAMRDVGLSGVFTFGTGTPYTPTDQKGNQIGLQNSARLPSTYDLDGRISKDFRFLGMSFSLVCDITNILNTEIITNVFTTTGKPNYTGVIITPQQFSSAGLLFGDAYYAPQCDYNHDGFITQWEQYDSYIKAYNDLNDPPTYYGPPRKIRVGLSLSF